MNPPPQSNKSSHIGCPATCIQIWYIVVAPLALHGTSGLTGTMLFLQTTITRWRGRSPTTQIKPQQRSTINLRRVNGLRWSSGTWLPPGVNQPIGTSLAHIGTIHQATMGLCLSNGYHQLNVVPFSCSGFQLVAEQFHTIQTAKSLPPDVVLGLVRTLLLPSSGISFAISEVQFATTAKEHQGILLGRNRVPGLNCSNLMSSLHGHCLPLLGLQVITASLEKCRFLGVTSFPLEIAASPGPRPKGREALALGTCLEMPMQNRSSSSLGFWQIANPFLASHAVESHSGNLTFLHWNKVLYLFDLLDAKSTDLISHLGALLTSLQVDLWVVLSPMSRNIHVVEPAIGSFVVDLDLELTLRACPAKGASSGPLPGCARSSKATHSFASGTTHLR